MRGVLECERIFRASHSGIYNFAIDVTTDTRPVCVAADNTSVYEYFDSCVMLAEL